MWWYNYHKRFESSAGDLARLIISKEHEFNYWQRCGLTVMNLILRQYAIIIKQIFLVVLYQDMYRDETNSLQIQLSRTQAGLGRAVKEQQEQNSPNHVQIINLISVLIINWFSLINFWSYLISSSAPLCPVDQAPREVGIRTPASTTCELRARREKVPLRQNWTWDGVGVRRNMHGDRGWNAPSVPQFS